MKGKYKLREYKCIGCGKVFSGRFSKNRKYCSHKCYFKYGLKGDKNPFSKPKIKLICKECGKEFEVCPSEITNSRNKIRKFCSKECFGRWSSINLVGEKHHNWLGGLWDNKEYRAERRREYNKKNIEKVKMWDKYKRTKRLGSVGSHTLKQWQDLKELYNYTCPWCGKSEPEIKLTEDHIQPIIKNGMSYIDNIQPLCRSCNSIKHDKIIFFKPILC